MGESVENIKVVLCKAQGRRDIHRSDSVPLHFSPGDRAVAPRA
jgi:hypothetical protein